MAYVPAYPSRINWEDEPSTATALNQINLNKMDYAIYQHDQALQLFDGRISTLEGASYVNSFKGRTGAVTPAQDDYTIDQIKATGTAGQYVTLDSNGKLNLTTLPAYPTAGHVVVSQSGSTMTQRSKMKFMGSVSVTDDSANDQTVINITGGGGGGSGHTILDPTGSSMNQRTNLQFTGSGVTVSDNSTDDKTVVHISSSGHTIKDGSGTAMTAQPNLQFVDAKVTNDAQGQATKIQNFEDINWDDWQNVDDDDDTYYRVTDAPLVDGNVEVDLMKKLWENPAPTASFVAQNVTLSSDDYDFLLWVFKYNVSTNRLLSQISQKGGGTFLAYPIAGSTRSRIVNRTSDTVYSVDSGYQDSTATDSVCIPIAIYGIKQKVTIPLSAIISNVSTSASKCMLSDGETSVEDTLDYSTDEHVVGKWIDGSTLYEKTIQLGTLAQNATTSINHNISNFKKLISKAITLTNGTNYLSLDYYDGQNRGNSYVTSTQIRIILSGDFTNYTGEATLRYTKTS